MLRKALAIISSALLILAVILLLGRPHQFSDPMTHGRDGGWLATWGPETCAIWTWHDADVVTTGLPFNCSPT